jgi:hypothetical protein
MECGGDKMKKSLVLFIFIFVVQNNFAAGRIETHSQSQALLFKQKRVDWKGAPESSVFYECCLFRLGDGVGLVDYFLKTGFLKDTVLFIRFDESGMAEIEVDNYRQYLMDSVVDDFEKTFENLKFYKCVVLYAGSFMGTAQVNIFSAELIKARVGLVSGTQVTFRDNRRTLIEIDKWPEPTKYKIRDLQAELAKVEPKQKREWLRQILLYGKPQDIHNIDDEGINEFEKRIMSEPLLKLKL